MSKVLAVAARELRERWLLLPAGLVFGFAPLVLPAFGVDRAVMPFVGLVGTALLGLTAAVVVGSTMLARDATSGRLGFLFSRPLSWQTIWGGKWLAALLLVTASGFLAAIPWMAAYPQPKGGASSWPDALADPRGTLFFVLLLFLGIGVANFNATAYRSRSGWLAVDFVLLLVAAWAVRRYLGPLVSLGILGSSLASTWGFLPLLPLALAFLAASAAQVAVGRTDVSRAHRAMSITFWAIVLGTLLLAALRLAWAAHASPRDIAAHRASFEPSGRWLLVSGESRRGGTAAFLMDATDGRYLPLGIERPWWMVGMAFSADGTVAATPSIRSGSEGWVLSVFDLGPGPLAGRDVVLESSPPPRWGSMLALSPSGATVLLAHETGASLFDLATGRRAATATTTGWWRVCARFLTETTVRVWLRPTAASPADFPGARIRVVDLEADGTVRTKEFPLLVPGKGRGEWAVERSTVVDATGRRVLTGDAGWHLRDGATGSLLATLAESSDRVLATIAADGRILLAEGAGARTTLRVFSPDGVVLGDSLIDLVPAGLGLGPEVSPSRVAVHGGASFADGETLVYDLTEQRVVEALPGLRPIGAGWGFESSPPPSRATASHVHFFVGGGNLVRIDFATGARRVVAGPGAQPGERISLR